MLTENQEKVSKIIKHGKIKNKWKNAKKYESKRKNQCLIIIKEKNTNTKLPEYDIILI